VYCVWQVVRTPTIIFINPVLKNKERMSLHEQSTAKVSSELATALTLSILVFWDFTLFGGDFDTLQRFDSAAQPTIPENENP
jgi:hypothetical protein